MTSPDIAVNTSPARRRIRRVLGSEMAAAMVIANLAGALLYLWGASNAWAIPEERAAGITTVTGEPFIWALFVLPVWGALLLLNLAWVVWGRRRGEKPRALWWGLVLTVWLMALVFDFVHH